MSALFAIALIWALSRWIRGSGANTRREPPAQELYERRLRDAGRR